MVWVRHRSDSRGERKVHTAVARRIAAAGIAASTLTGNPTLTVIAFAIGVRRIRAAAGVLQTLPTAAVRYGAAAGIAAIN